MSTKANVALKLAACFEDLACIIMFSSEYVKYDCKSRARYYHCIGKEQAYRCIGKALSEPFVDKRETVYVMWYDSVMLFASQLTPKNHKAFMKAFASVNPTLFGLGQSAGA